MTNSAYQKGQPYEGFPVLSDETLEMEIPGSDWIVIGETHSINNRPGVNEAGPVPVDMVTKIFDRGRYDSYVESCF